MVCSIFKPNIAHVAIDLFMTYDMSDGVNKIVKMAIISLKQSMIL